MNFCSSFSSLPGCNPLDNVILHAGCWLPCHVSKIVELLSFNGYQKIPCDSSCFRCSFVSFPFCPRDAEDLPQFFHFRSTYAIFVRLLQCAFQIRNHTVSSYNTGNAYAHNGVTIIRKRRCNSGNYVVTIIEKLDKAVLNQAE